MKEITANLRGVTHYFDDIVIYGRNQTDRDENLKAFLHRASEIGLSLNSSKCLFNTSSMVFLGQLFHEGTISPEPSRMKPLVEFPTPKTQKELERLVGIFVYYSKWVKNFADLAEPLFEAKTMGIFPLSNKAIDVINKLKDAICKSSLAIPEQGKTLTIGVFTL